MRKELVKLYILCFILILVISGCEKQVIQVDQSQDPYAELHNKDSDGDQMSDYEETRIFQTNENSRDTDCDEASDLEEIKLGSNPGKGYNCQSNTQSRDTDGDFFTDGEEIKGLKDSFMHPTIYNGLKGEVFDFSQQRISSSKADILAFLQDPANKPVLINPIPLNIVPNGLNFKINYPHDDLSVVRGFENAIESLNFIIRYSCNFFVPSTGDVTFSLNMVDDGAIIYLDNVIVVEALKDVTGPGTGTNTINVSKGSHSLIIIFWQTTFSASLEVKVAMANQPLSPIDPKYIQLPLDYNNSVILK